MVIGISLDTVPLTQNEVKIYGVSNQTLSQTALSIIRARNTDPIASHSGAFIVLSVEVNEVVV